VKQAAAYEAYRKLANIPACLGCNGESGEHDCGCSNGR
jgi:hypothetical protein